MAKSSSMFKELRKGKAFLAFFRIHTVFYIISVVLLLVAINNAYDVYLVGNHAKTNAQTSLEKFDEIVLKNEPSELIDPTETVNMVGDVAYTPVAIISVDRIDLKVSVLSEWSYDLLDISVNKFSGPEPNEPGNFIVIGHNYINDAHFGNLHLLKVGDTIDLTDLKGRTLTYEVYEVLIIKPTEVDKLETKDIRSLTLVTCDKNNAYRLVIKSKAKNSL